MENKSGYVLLGKMLYQSLLLFSLILFNIFSLNTIAKPLGDLSFETVGDSESIPYGIVTTLLQDQSGFIWIGTQDGLVRYDGYRFRLYAYDPKRSNSIAGNYILALHQAEDGRLWIGTLSSGISVYNPQTESFTNYQHQENDINSLSHNQVTSITTGANGGIWVGTHSGLDHWLPQQDGFSHYSAGLKDKRISSLLLDKQNTLWVGSAAGLYRFNHSLNNFEPALVESDNAEFLSQLNVLTLLQALDGKIWFGSAEHGVAWIEPTNQSLNRLQLSSINSKAVALPWVKSILQPNPQQIWLGTTGNGIVVIDATNGDIIEQLRHDASIASSINLNNISALLTDKSGILWVGTWGGGINKINLSGGAFRTLRHSPTQLGYLSHADIVSVLELKDGNWQVGTGGNGIDIVDPQKGLVGAFRPNQDLAGSLTDGAVSAIAQLNEREVWLGTQSSGIFKLDLATRQFQHFGTIDGLINNAINTLLATTEGLWVGTSGGLSFFELSSGHFTNYFDSKGQPFHENIYPMTLDENENLWVGTSHGLYLLRKGQRQLQQFTHDSSVNDSLSHNDIYGLLFDSNQRLWVDTAQGLDRLVSFDNETAHFESISNKVNRPGLYFGANLLEDSLGRIWTQWYVLDPKNWRIWPITKADGVDIGTAWVTSFSKTRAGLLLYGGTQGLLIVQPEKFKPWDYQPQLVISELTVDGQQQPINSSLNLTAGQTGFSLEFTSMDFSAPEKNRYAHKLDGIDHRWIETSADNRRVTYTNLKPGQYTLQLKGSNRLGEWSHHQISFPIIVLPAWHQTLWIYSLYILLIISAIFLLVKWQRIKVFTATERVKQEQKLNRDLLRVDKLKDEILTNTSHELRTPLNGIIGLSESLACSNEEMSAETIDSLKLITASGHRLLNLVNDLLDLTQLNSSDVTLNIQPTNLVDAVEKAITISNNFAQQKNLELINNVPFNSPCVLADKDRLQQILINLIGNGIKFTNQGSIQINTHQQGSYIQVSVIDTGIGIDIATFEDIFKIFHQVDGSSKRAYEGSGLGLSICKRLVELHGSQIEVSSSLGKGATFAFALPIGQ